MALESLSFTVFEHIEDAKRCTVVRIPILVFIAVVVSGLAIGQTNQHVVTHPEVVLSAAGGGIVVLRDVELRLVFGVPGVVQGSIRLGTPSGAQDLRLSEVRAWTLGSPQGADKVGFFALAADQSTYVVEELLEIQIRGTVVYDSRATPYGLVGQLVHGIDSELAGENDFLSLYLPTSH